MYIAVYHLLYTTVQISCKCILKTGYFCNSNTLFPHLIHQVETSQ